MVDIHTTPLRAFAETLIRQTGASPETAERVADVLVGADIRGHTSHGVRLISLYSRLIAGDTADLSVRYPIDPMAEPTVTEEGPLTATIDGQSAFGHIVGELAVDTGVRKAEKQGMCIVGVRNATHMGRIGEWAERAAEEGMVFAAFVNGQGGGPVAPPGSSRRRLFTNPIAFGVPTFDAFDFPVVFDMATSQVAHGKVLVRAAKGESIPDDWAVAPDGSPLTNPELFQDGEGALLPLGGRTAAYKGFGLSAIAELFAGIVGDTVVAGQSTEGRGNAAAFVLFDPTVFTTRAAIAARIEAYAEYMRETDYNTNVSPGMAAYGDRALLPGEAEYRIAANNRESGIPIPDSDAVELCEIAAENGVADAVPEAFAPHLKRALNRQ